MTKQHFQFSCLTVAPAPARSVVGAAVAFHSVLSAGNICFITLLRRTGQTARLPTTCCVALARSTLSSLLPLLVSPHLVRTDNAREEEGESD